MLESVTTLAYAAAITKRLRLGIAVLIINQRNPIDLAKALSSVDVLSNRLIVGVGLGHSTKYYPAYGLASEARVARFRENLAIMKRLWTEDRVTMGAVLASRKNSDGTKARSETTSDTRTECCENGAPTPPPLHPSNSSVV